MRWAATYLFLLLVFAALPNAEAGQRYDQVTLLAAPSQLQLEVTSSAWGAEASGLRNRVDTDFGNSDGMANASEVGLYQDSLRVEVFHDDPACYGHLTFFQIEGATPRRLRSATHRLVGAAGAKESEAPISIVSTYVFLYPPLGVSGAQLAVDFSRLDLRTLVPPCADPPAEALATFDLLAPSGPDWRSAGLAVRPQGSRKLDPATISAESVASLWDGVGIRAVESDDRAVLLNTPFLVSLAGPRPASPVAPGGSAGGAALLVGAALAGAAASFGMGSMEIVRYRLLRWLAALPSFTRLRRDELLDHQRRDQIYALVQAEPGVCLADLRRRIGVAHGTAFHHLRMLERQGYLTVVRDGFRARFFPRGPRIHPSPYLTEVQQALLGLLAQRPGLSQSDVAAACNMPRKTAAYHLERLESLGLARRVRNGRRRQYFRQDPSAPVSPPFAGAPASALPG